MASKIAWTGETWNPMHGCTKISSGCDRCYAERQALRLKGMGLKAYKGGFDVVCQPERLQIPFKWLKPRMVFVNSMGDLFHDQVPDDFILRVFDVMNKCPQHTFQVLTKRPDRMLELNDQIKWTENIWAGVTVERFRNRPRVKTLRETAAHVKFISFEPLLDAAMISLESDRLLSHDDIDWVIVGGENGPGARRMNPQWLDRIYSAARQYGVPFFFKGWGTATLKQGDPSYNKFRGREYEEMPGGIEL